MENQPILNSKSHYKIKISKKLLDYPVPQIKEVEKQMENEFEIIEKRDPFFRCKCCNNFFYKEDINKHGLCFICSNGSYKPEVKPTLEYNEWDDF